MHSERKKNVGLFVFLSVQSIYFLCLIKRRKR